MFVCFLTLIEEFHHQISKACLFLRNMSLILDDALIPVNGVVLKEFDLSIAWDTLDDVGLNGTAVL